MKELVSVIVPCYNQGQYLEETLLSVKNQTYTNLECLIIDDGSTDNTEHVAKQICTIDQRFRYYFKNNGGLSSARNFGLRLAKGDWIQLLDSDDLIEKDKIDYQIDLIGKFKAEILISGYRYFKNTEGYDSLRILGRNNLIPEVNLQQEDSLDLIRLFELANPFVISAPLYKKSVFQKIGFFDEEFHALEDWDFHLRCAKGGIKFQHVGYRGLSKTLIRIHDGSMMSSNDSMSLAYDIFSKKHNLQTFGVILPRPHFFKRVFKKLLPPFIIEFYHFVRK